MTSPFDPEDRAPDDLDSLDAELPLPSDAELADTEQVLADLRDGHLVAAPEPSLQLLRVAAGPASADELEDRIGFATLVASQAVLPPVAAPEHDAERSRGRVGLIGRILATKAAVVAAVTVLGIAGAGAATGLIVAVRSSPTTTTTTALVPTEAAASDTAVAGRWADDEAGPNPIVGGPRVRCARAHTEAGRLGVAGAAERAGLTPEQYCDGLPVGTAGPSPEGASGPPVAPTEVPGADSSGATPDGPESEVPSSNEPDQDSGNSPNAGGNPDPGSNGADNGNGKNAGGNPDPGSNGNKGNHTNNAGGNPDPGSNGNKGNHTNNAGGNPDPGANAGGNGGGKNSTTGGNPSPGSNGASNGNSSNGGGKGNGKAKAGAATDNPSNNSASNSNSSNGKGSGRADR